MSDWLQKCDFNENLKYVLEGVNLWVKKPKILILFKDLPCRPNAHNVLPNQAHVTLSIVKPNALYDNKYHV